MPAFFVSSFDAASPFGGWSFATGVTSVAGRTLNGANMPTGGDLRKDIGAVGSGATVVGGAAMMFVGGFSNNPMTFLDAVLGTVTADFRHTGDGRFYLDLSSYLNGTLVVTTGPSGVAIHTSEFYFFEFQVSITVFVVLPETIDTSSVRLAMQSILFINEQPVLTCGYDETVVLNNADIKPPQFNRFSLGFLGGGLSTIIDDVYLSNAQLGDGSVAPTDLTFDTNAADSDLTQVVLEWSAKNDTTLILTQALLEVLLTYPNDSYFPEYVKRRNAPGH